MKASPFYIREHQYPNGSTAYRVSGMRNGKQLRHNFGTMAEAAAKKQELDAEFHNLPQSVPLVSTRLTVEQAAEAERAYAELGGKPLMPAVRFYLENFREAVTPMELGAAYDEFLADKQKQNLRADSITNLRVKVNFLVREHKGKNVSDILPDHIKDCVFTKGRSPVSANNVRRALFGFFVWAVERGYCKANPVEKTKVAEVDETEPEILPLADARKLIETAATYKDGICLPYVALGLFCAIRPDKEIARLGWNDIDLEHGTITLGGRIAKMRGRRVVEMEANAVKWLLPHAVKRTPLRPGRRDFDALKRLCGYGGRASENDAGKLKPWVPDFMRHTAISYHLALHEHEGKTAAWAGNSPDVIQKHYKGLVKGRGDAKAFWSISPSDAKRKILKMKLAA